MAHEVRRLSLNLPAAAAETLDDLVGRLGTSTTEVIRESLALHRTLLDEMAKGTRILFEHPGKEGEKPITREILLVDFGPNKLR